MADAIPVTGSGRPKVAPSINPNKIPAGGVPVDAKTVDADFSNKGEPKKTKLNSGNTRIDY